MTKDNFCTKKTEEWQKLDNDELYHLYNPHIIARVTKPR
jgi:hypothetical protein